MYYQLEETRVGVLPVHLHKAHSDKQEEEPHAFQNESINGLYIKADSWPNKMNKSCELCTFNNIHNNNLF